jgi:ribosomal protein S6
VYYTEMNSDSVDAINHIVRINKNILRSMIISHSDEWPKSFKI